MKHIRIGAISLALTLTAAPVSAETLVVGDQVQLRASSVATPTRGSTMSTVESRFGAPRSRQEAVGQPPITRWDYASFSVYFEHERVIHAVAVSR